MASLRMRLRSLGSRFKQRLLGCHPYNTIFNYNWVNVRPMVRTFRALGHLFQGRVVDLGAGASPYYDLIAPMAKLYIAIDYPSAMPGKDRRKIERAAGILEAVPLATESVDTVFCTQVLCQVPHPEAALREIARIMRPGGYAIISVPHVSPLHSEPYDLYRFTPDGLSRLANAAGLQTHSIHTQGRLFAAFALCLAMNLVLSPLVPGQPMRLLPRRQLLFAPLIALVNGIAYLLDTLLPFSRIPVNFIAIVTKPLR